MRSEGGGDPHRPGGLSISRSATTCNLIPTTCHDPQELGKDLPFQGRTRRTSHDRHNQIGLFHTRDRGGPSAERILAEASKVRGRDETEPFSTSDRHRVDPALVGNEPERRVAVVTFPRVDVWRTSDGSVPSTAAEPKSGVADSGTREGVDQVPDFDRQVDEGRSHQIVFPMAVGAIFLAMLIAGALFG